MFGQIDKTSIGGSAGAHMAYGVEENPFFKKPEENPYSNANLPGGIFTAKEIC